MKTILISETSPVPAELRDAVERGSTSVQRRRASEITRGESLDADRVVFWAAAGDDRVRQVARDYVSRRRGEPGDAVVFVTPDGTSVPEGLAENELFVWPRDEDRLVIAFMTGA